MTTAAQVEEFRAASQSLTDVMQSQLRDVLSGFSPSTNPRVVRDVLLNVFPDFMTVFGDTAAVLGADFYDLARDLPPSAGTVQSVLAQPAKTKQSEKVVRWAVDPLFDPDPGWASFESSILGAAQRLVLMPARDTVDLMARSDARSGKVVATRWARQLHPERAKSGKSCDFCKMLAGRGVVYRSDAAAGMVVGRGSDRTGLDADGNRLSGGIGGGVVARGSQGLANSYHDNCHCVPVPTFYRSEKATFKVRGYSQTESVLVPIND